LEDEANLVIWKYLYWASYRHYNMLANNLVIEYHISPFLIGPNQQSVLMGAVEGKSPKVVDLLLAKRYVAKDDQDYLEWSKRQNDKFGSNTLHTALKNYKTDIVESLLKANIADISERNVWGKTPAETAHNEPMCIPEMQKLLKDYFSAEKAASVSLEKEADYVFIVPADRRHVLISQLDSIDHKYSEKQRNKN
jgi:hypothetical protein